MRRAGPRRGIGALVALVLTASGLSVMATATADPNAPTSDGVNAVDITPEDDGGVFPASAAVTAAAEAVSAARADCIPNPYGERELFLRGGMNSWGTSPSYRFVYNCDRFELLFDASGRLDFKVADAGWTASSDFGRPGGAGQPATGTPFTLAAGGGNLNYTFTGKHLATLDVSQSATAPTLRLDTCTTSPWGDVEIDLLGDLGGQAASEPFVWACNAYYQNLDVEGTYSFKVGNAATPETTFGAGSDVTVVQPDQPFALTSAAQDASIADLTFAFAGEHTAKVDFTAEGTPQLTIRDRSFVNPGVPVIVTNAIAKSVSFDSRDEADKAPFGAVTEGSAIDFSLEALPGVTSATLVVEKRLFEGNADVLDYVDAERVPLVRSAAGDGLERWSGSHTFDPIAVYGYYFELEIAGRDYVYMNNDSAVYWTAERGTFGEGVISYVPSSADQIRRYRQTVYAEDFTVPEWAKDGVYYYMFPERFRDGDSSNNPAPGTDTYLGGPVEVHENWNDRPSIPGSGDGFDGTWNNDFFGGDLAGVTEKLDYMEELGVTILYMTPIMEAGSNHKYDTADYLQVDNGFGTNEDFELLTQQAEERGIRVVVDASFNHSGADSRYFDRYGRYDDLGAFEGGTVQPESPWADLYEFDGQSYAGWGGASMPELAESEAWKNIAFRNDDSITTTWLDRGASGWRMDVAPWVSDDFWREWRTNLKADDPDALAVAETWFDSSKFFLGDTFDTTMNYIFRNSVIDYANGGDAQEVYQNIELMRESYPEESFYALMNLLSTHDAARALHEFGYTSTTSSATTIEQAKQRLRLAVFFQMTFPGTPAVYYGDEVGVTGGEDPQNRRTYPWADEGGSPDESLLADYQELIAMRHDNDVLRRGSIDAPIYLDEDLIVLAREHEGVLAVTAYNNGTTDREVTVEIPEQFADLTFTDALTGEVTTAGGASLTISAPAVFGTALISEALPAFVDVPKGTMFFDDIQWLFTNGISTGWENADGTREFRPLTPIARDAMAAFLYRQAGSPEWTAPEVSPFSDVAPSDQFYEEISWLSEKGISTGWDNGDGTASFRPLEPIGRDAMAAFLYRMAEEPEFAAPATSPFTDVTPQTQFYKEITWLVHEEIATGWQGNDGTAIYQPVAPINRDAMAAFLHRYDDAGFSDIG
ncbi:hypothetical protein C8046_11925 [Serinibacter arcticus]|uniref:SLH domain-containing protein n=1 Tax=Serinibacter arcticus TaxID=1655435 RepID=A0A2U1ZW86_9MICO|nr:alpha-amylase family glycosyl hydrolase [Serinibacter arcticus]PWD51257.1 hypothetical protein C8046_11925 [Serinibacter arcticus]